MTGYDVERTLFKILCEEYQDTPVDSGSPGSFDPESAGVTDWIHWTLEEIRENPTRRENLRSGRVRLLLQCWNKDRDGVKPAKATAEAISELFRHRVIPVVDFDEVDTPEIGYVEFFEPRIVDTSARVEQGYQCVVVTIEGREQES